MKHIALIAIMALASSQSFARRCNSESIASTRCEISVSGNSIPSCRIGNSTRDYVERYPGANPYQYRTFPVPGYYGWERSEINDSSEVCDVDLQECKDLAFRALEKLNYTSNCGDISRGTSVEFSFQTLNGDGSVRAEQTGRFKK